MGFLLGAYGKLAAGSRYRSLQARAMRIQSKLRRATRQIETVEKMIDRQQKMALNSLTASATAEKNSYQSMMYAAMQDPKYKDYQDILDRALKGGEGAPSKEEVANASSMMSTIQNQFNQQMSSVNSMIEMNATMKKQQIEDYFEQMRENILEPLKQEEDSLQLEKDSVESQLEIAKQDYEACKQMEKTDAQMLKPDYTGATS